MKKHIAIIIACMVAAITVAAQTDDSTRRTTLDEVNIGAEREKLSRMGGAEIGQVIGQDELFRAACCSLGESFVTNPSVDVNYNDAAVGAKQIRLLGLNGQYVQMLVDGLPMPSLYNMPYQLGRVPGLWMRSIQVSKGASSVKNGAQSITGQIDVEYHKPEEEQGLLLNVYANSNLMLEGNMVGNLHITPHLSTEVLASYQHDFMHHDANHDGWIDMPTVEQYNFANRWKYAHGRYIMHAGVGFLQEERHGGTMASHMAKTPDILIKSRGAEAYMKHAYLINRSHNTNIALLANASLLETNGRLGLHPQGRLALDATQQQLASQLVLEHEFTEAHLLSAGISFLADHITEHLVYSSAPNTRLVDPSGVELTPGAYAQYTFKPSYRFTGMAGIRVDRSSLFARTYATPRMHLKWTPIDWLTLRASVGKGYRTPHPAAEYHHLLTSGRRVSVGAMDMEEAWNSGIGAAVYVPVGEQTITLGAEYFYTHFVQQLVVDYDSDPTAISIAMLDGGRSFSHTLQLDASYAPTDEWNMLLAVRFNNVKCTYGSQLLEKPLQPRFKGLFTIGWEPMMALWHIDLTVQLNGPGRMPRPYTLPDGNASWDERSPAYLQIDAQVTRDFRHCSVYIGAQNLTNYKQPVPVVDAANYGSATFDPTMLWGPVDGIVAYAGARINLWR